MKKENLHNIKYYIFEDIDISLHMEDNYKQIYEGQLCLKNYIDLVNVNLYQLLLLFYNYKICV